MARGTVYNNITSEEKLKNVNSKNIDLGNEFIDYLKSIDRSETTIKQYIADLKIFWCWNLEFNNNKDFIKITKREFSKFQNHCLNEWNWSSNRIRRVKSVISSMSNFIENILDEEEEFEGYRSSIRKIESPVKEIVREKSIFTEEELQLLLDTLVKKKKYLRACALALAMYSGRRKSELPRFKVSYFDDENILFGGAMFKTNEKVKTKGRGKGKFVQLYVLRKPFLPYLELWMNERKEKGIDSEWLLCDDDGNPIKTAMLDGWVDSFTKIVGKDFYWHSMRHFFTTMLSENNIPNNVIQEIVAWTSADMVTLYTDTNADDSIGKYFDENGIKQVDKGDLTTL